MTSIWAFLLQTLSVSLVAALLLLVKAILGDKLSPRWQYGVWGVLALRILLPASAAGRYILLPLPLWTETVKAVAERSLSSAYSAAYAPAVPRFPVPWVTGLPASVTDWLFIVYIAGAAAFALRYAVGYIRLRALLRRGRPAPEAVTERIAAVCAAYGLKACPAVAVEGLPSAFVAGIARPVLAVPDGGIPDDKVLLHELLHLKHHDALQSVVWSVFRTLHWCNPFLQLVFNRIGNDMESLCDQRVLERLEGEARREYGAILLSMVSEKYPRAPGTTSLSNGGANIGRRIGAIARFQKYPKGMALVSVCIAVLLLQPALMGARAKVVPPASGRTAGLWAFELAMASARTARCSTAAGALDTYAKGVLLDNGIYIAMASPLSAQAALADQMRAGAPDGQTAGYTLQGYLGGSWARASDAYKVFNLQRQDDGSYSALLVFRMDSLIVDARGTSLKDESGGYPAGVVWFPVRASNEDGWVVERTGETEHWAYPPGVTVSSDWSFLPPQTVYAAEGATGTVTAELRAAYAVDNMPDSAKNTIFFGSSPPFDETLKPDAEFTERLDLAYATFTFAGTDKELESLSSAGFMLAAMTDADTMPPFYGASDDLFRGDKSVSGSHFSSANEVVADGWDRKVFIGGGGRTSGSLPVDITQPPAGYAAVIYLNGERRETLILKAVSGGE